MTASRATLRPVIVTIDGPAGTGKSTVAHRLSERLGLEFLDTGAMYRAAAVVSIERGIDPADGAALAAAVRNSNLRFDWTTDPPRITLDGRDVSERIRELDVGGVVSVVAAQTQVRSVLVERQRKIAAEHPRLVTEGRDQGSVVFPDAALRFYLHADAAIRATRRAEQLARAGKRVDQDQVYNEIMERDRRDAGRSDGPLIRPEGAIDVDTGSRTIEQVVDVMEAIARESLPDADLRP